MFFFFFFFCPVMSRASLLLPVEQICCTASLVTVRMRCGRLWRDARCVTTKEHEGRDASLFAGIATASCDHSVSAATAVDCHRPRAAVPRDPNTVRARNKGLEE